MSAVLGLFRALLIMVAIVIIALLIYGLTMEKIKAIATLKPMGAHNRVIVRMILEQSLVLTIASFIFGYALVLATQDMFPRRLMLLPTETLNTFLVMLAGGVLALELNGITGREARRSFWTTWRSATGRTPCPPTSPAASSSA